MDTMTQFQIKGGRSVHTRDIFYVSGKRYKSFLKKISTRNFLCEEETLKKIENVDFWGVLYHLTASFHLKYSALMHSK